MNGRDIARRNSLIRHAQAIVVKRVRVAAHVALSLHPLPTTFLPTYSNSPFACRRNGSFWYVPEKSANQPRRLRHNREGCVHQPRIRLLERRQQSSMRNALPHRERQITDAARPQIVLQSLVGIDLAVLGGLRFMSQT